MNELIHDSVYLLLVINFLAAVVFVPRSVDFLLVPEERANVYVMLCNKDMVPLYVL